MWSIPTLSSHPGPLWPGVVTLDRVLFMGQIELNCALMLNWIVWNGTVFGIETVYLHKTELFEIELFICIKMDLALNNLQCLICHKTDILNGKYKRVGFGLVWFCFIVYKKFYFIKFQKDLYKNKKFYLKKLSLS